MDRILRLSLERTTPVVYALAIAMLLMGPPANGQTAGGASPLTVVDVLHELSDKADVIFAGQVIAVRHPTGADWVEVEFRVDQAIRGCSVGAPYVLREWAGLWAGGDQRYRVGQRLLMLLHAPSAAGMSSPVGGLDGAIPIRQGGTATPVADGATPPQRPFVDLRWLGTKLPRVVSYRSESTHAAKPAGAPRSFLEPQQMASVATSGSITTVAPIAPMLGDASPSDASVPAQQASVDAVMSMLSSWQRAHHAAP
jgi:hypothetical protein